MHQLDFTINWNIAPSFDRFRVSNKLLLEVLACKAHPDWITLAYVGMEDEKNYYKEADSLIDLFLLTCALISDFTGTYHGGARIKILNLEDLGNRRALFKMGYNTLEFYATPLEKILKPITLLKNRFLQLEASVKLVQFSNYWSGIIHGGRHKSEMPIKEINVVKEYIKTAIKKTLSLKL
jgi:hypothetical protein